jgi:lysine decarboxylase
VIDGLVLSGGVPSYVAPEYGEELGMAHGVTPDALAEALRATPGARAAWIVSPTYYGMAADVAGCAEVCQAAGVPLVVDQAWGSHFGFHPDLPPSRAAAGRRRGAHRARTRSSARSPSRRCCTSRRPGGSTPTSWRARVRLVRSTSPSSLLMASLDAARRQLVIHGQALLSRTIAASNRARKIIDGTTACSVVGRELVGQPGVAGWDPLRIVVDVRATGNSGYEVAAALRSAYDVHVELATHATLVLVLGLGQPADALDRFTHDFATTVRRIERPGDAEALVRTSAALVNEVVVPPREAFLGASETVPVDDAVGRVSAESIAGYPPGIPALLPGERITAEGVGYLRELRDLGRAAARASDPSFPHHRRAVSA